MNIVCPNCGQTCETEDELVIGQHALCPFCNVKFTYGDSASTAESRPAGKPMDVKCPGCGTEYEVDASEVGQDVECEVCGRTFVVGAKDCPVFSNLATHSDIKDVTADTVVMTTSETAITVKIPRPEQIKQTTTIDYDGNKRYFSVENTENGKAAAQFDNCSGGCMLAVGVIIGCICCGAGASECGAGFIMFGAGVIIASVIAGLFCFLKVKEKPKFKPDKEIDAQASGMGIGLEDRALNKLGLDPDEVSMVEPLRFWGYRFADPSVLGDVADAKACWIAGKDGKLRSAEVSHTIFYFGEHSVYCYVRTTSLVNGRVSNERTEEYFYRDIVSVKTDTIEATRGKVNKHSKSISEMSKLELELSELESKPVQTKVNVFVLVNTGGERLECEVENQTEADAAVRAFRTLLKQKKF